MKIKAFQFSIILLILGVISIFVPSVVFADGHETEGEISQELEVVTEELEVAKEELEQVTATIKNLEEELEVTEAKSEKEMLELKVEEEKPGVSGWFQIDIDSLGSYFLIGASHPVGGISIASNIYVNPDHNGKKVGEFDLGVTLPVIKGDISLALQPMVGIGFDYAGADGPDALFPQVFAFLNAPNITFFHWTIASLYSPFGEAGEIITHTTSEENVEHGTIPLSDVIYTRNFLTYSLNETIAIGPQFELLTSLDNMGEPINLNFGVRFNIGYGKANTLGIYVGYETEKMEDDTGLTGRMNFTRFW